MGAFISQPSEIDRIVHEREREEQLSKAWYPHLRDAGIHHEDAKYAADRIARLGVAFKSCPIKALGATTLDVTPRLRGDISRDSLDKVRMWQLMGWARRGLIPWSEVTA